VSTLPDSAREVRVTVRLVISSFPVGDVVCEPAVSCTLYSPTGPENVIGDVVLIGIEVVKVASLSWRARSATAEF